MEEAGSEPLLHLRVHVNYQLKAQLVAGGGGPGAFPRREAGQSQLIPVIMSPDPEPGAASTRTPSAVQSLTVRALASSWCRQVIANLPTVGMVTCVITGARYYVLRSQSP